MENRNGLVMKPCVSEAGTRQDRDAGLRMLAELLKQIREKRPAGAITGGADKGYQEQDFIEGLRKLSAIPRVAEYQKSRRSWLTAREREGLGFQIRQSKRKLEKIFGWMKVVAGQRKIKFRGRRRVHWMFSLGAAAYNLIRMAKLIPAV
jgi:hypothetical protein